MFKRGSRYEYNDYFLPSKDRGMPFRGKRPRHVVTLDGALEHTLTEGNRLDLLALNYYNDPNKWWLILDANPEITFDGGLNLDRYVGTVILIPQVRQPEGI